MLYVKENLGTIFDMKSIDNNEKVMFKVSEQMYFDEWCIKTTVGKNYKPYKIATLDISEWIILEKNFRSFQDLDSL